MNSLRFLIFTLLLASASIRAMEEDRTLVSFDESTHGAQARALFKDTVLACPCYLASTAASVARGPSYGVKVTVKILLLKDTVIGVAAYYDSQKADKSVIRNLDVLVIDEKYRKHPKHHGTYLMQKLEEKSLKEGIKAIKLPLPLASSAKFYEKIGYEGISPHYRQMQKILNSTDSKD
jgi:hypothetical protein